MNNVLIFDYDGVLVDSFDIFMENFIKACKQQGFEGPCAACVLKAWDSEDASVRGMASWYNNTVLKQQGKQVELKEKKEST